MPLSAWHGLFCHFPQVSQEVLDQTLTMHWNCRLSLAAKRQRMAQLLNGTLTALPPDS